MRRILISLSLLFISCGSENLSPGSGAPLSSLKTLPTGIEFSGDFNLATALTAVEFFSLSDTSQDCSGGGTTNTHSSTESLSVNYSANYNSCKVTLTLVGINYTETIDGTVTYNQSPDGFHEKTALSLSGDLGLAIACDITTSLSLSNTGTCKVYDAEGTKIDIPLGSALVML